MRKRKNRRPWYYVLLSRLVIYPSAAALVVSYLSAYINPTQFTPTLFFGLYFIPLVMLNLLLLVLGIIRGSRATWITFVALLPAVLYAELFVRWGEVQRGDEGISLKICSYNVGLFSQGANGLSRGESLKGVVSVVKEHNPHIVCLQEYYVRDTSEISHHFPNYPYKYYHLYRGKGTTLFGNLLLSKYPIKSSGKITFKGSTNLCIYSDIDHFGKIIRVYNTHLESHSISFTALIKRLREREKFTSEIYDVHDKVANTFKRRSLQVDTIASHMHQCSTPSIICGDFNDTPISYTYKNLSAHKRDSFRQAGKGFSATYSLLWPLLRIDYILYPAPAWSISHLTPRVNYSDHYPVISELIIP